MPRKPEPHERRAARVLARLRFGPKVSWKALVETGNDFFFLADVRRILRAAGRGGKVIHEYDQWHGEYVDHHLMLLDCGKTRKRRTRNG